MYIISQWSTVMQAKDRHKCSAVDPDPGAGKLAKKLTNKPDFQHFKKRVFTNVGMFHDPLPS
jgi:hypothetical protein